MSVSEGDMVRTLALPWETTAARIFERHLAAFQAVGFYQELQYEQFVMVYRVWCQDKIKGRHLSPRSKEMPRVLGDFCEVCCSLNHFALVLISTMVQKQTMQLHLKLQSRILSPFRKPQQSANCDAVCCLECPLTQCLLSTNNKPETPHFTFHIF